MTLTSRALAERVVEGFASGRWTDPELWEPAATIWHNVDEIDLPESHSRARWQALRRAVPDFHAEETAVHAWEDGFALQYVFVGTLPDGSAVRIPGCIVGTVQGGRIVRMQEYVDSAHASRLAAAFLPAE